MTTHTRKALGKGARRSRMATDPLALEVGAQIRALRLARGMTGKALAAALGVPGTQVTVWERGRVVPSVRSLLLIAQALECDPTELLPVRRTDAAELAARLATLPAACIPDVERFITLVERAYAGR